MSRCFYVGKIIALTYMYTDKNSFSDGTEDVVVDTRKKTAGWDF